MRVLRGAGLRDLLGRAVGDAVPLRRDPVGGIGRVAQVDALGHGDMRLLERSGASQQDGAGRRVLTGEGHDARADQIGGQALEIVLGVKPLGHPRRGAGGQAVDADVELPPLQRQRLHQADQRHLGRAIVGLPEIAVQAGRRGGEDHPAIAALAHMIPGRLGQVDRAHQVDVQHQGEIVEVHLGEGPVAQDARVVDQDVDPAPVRDHTVDHGVDALAVGDAAGPGQGLAARRHDLGRDGLARRRSQIVDHDLRAISRQRERMTAAQSAARAGDDGHAGPEIDGHACSPCPVIAEPPADGGRTLMILTERSIFTRRRVRIDGVRNE